MTNPEVMRRNAGIEQYTAAVRDFNRFYTRMIGLLQAGYLETPYSLTEARVIFELARSKGPGDADAAALRGSLEIDAGYLSRILARFDADGLITRERSRADGRRHTISLTDAGLKAATLLNERADVQVKRLLAAVTDEDKARLTTAMAEIRQIIDRPQARQAGMVVLRPLRPGELGWVIQRNGAIYAEEYRWDESYEALVARIVADYAASHDPRREAAWIAEVDGAPAGCVFCVRDSDNTANALGAADTAGTGSTAGTGDTRETPGAGDIANTARLRLLLVEPRARGMGIGARLVAECVSFAEQAGYTDLVLWTNDVLAAARRIYEKAGFQLVESEPHRSFGHDLVGQTWRLPLAHARRGTPAACS
ncbi:MAG TPA: helix-turn-helix domain-containing GNAT family N-acetyltransferase [Streptosporangiaceae bacterium]|nr:helix-turn-helix domain-containing GNAT family N-acetyltransferase [Streptosporangiaceae bacterium]